MSIRRPVRSGKLTVLLVAGGLVAALTVAGVMPAAAATAPKPAPGLGVGAASIASNGTPAADVNVFYQRVDHGLTLKSAAGTTNLGGFLTSAPGAYAKAPTEFIDESVFARGGDNAVWYRNFSDGLGEWLPWASLGGVAAGAPSASCFGDTTTAVAVVFVRSPGGALWRRPVNGSWSSAGGNLLSDPAAVAAFGGTCAPAPEDVFALGTDHAVWERTLGHWVRVGGRSTVAPTATAVIDGSTDLFVRGTDNAAWMTTRPFGSTAWGPWHKVGGSFTSSLTAAIDVGPSSTSRVVLGLGTDGNVWRGRNVIGTSTWSWSQVS
jgi:hypothetical protein